MSGTDSIQRATLRDFSCPGLDQASRGGLLVVYACCCVYERETGKCLGEHPEDVPIYEAQLRYAFKHLAWRNPQDPWLVFSGTASKAPRVAEGDSHLQWAQDLGIAIPHNVTSEVRAATSSENLLFSVYRFHQLTGRIPAAIDVIAWAFKARRFAATLAAINRWGALGVRLPELGFFPVGNLSGAPLRTAEAKENTYIECLERRGLTGLYAEPAVQDLIAARDPHGLRREIPRRYAGYPLPF